MMPSGGFCYLWETTLGVAQYVCVRTWCVFELGVSANLQCMHIFEIDHMFICVKLKELSVLAGLLIMLISSGEFAAFSKGHAVVVFTLSVYKVENAVFPYKVMGAGCDPAVYVHKVMPAKFSLLV